MKTLPPHVNCCTHAFEHESEKADLRRLVEEAQAERDRLKGELTEARHDLGYYRRNFPGHCIPRPVAATPAEQAQPTSKDDDQCARCPWPRKHHGPTGKFPCEGFVEAAEQAQGEGAKPNVVWASQAQLDERMRVSYAQVAELAKRVDALTARLDRITSPPSRPFVSEVKRHWDDPAVRDNFVDATLDDHESRLRDLEWRFKTPPEAAAPTCRKLIESLGALCTRRLDHGGGCEHDTREATGPGHVCDHPKLWCSHPIHAVPPIVGGAT